MMGKRSLWRFLAQPIQHVVRLFSTLARREDGANMVIVAGLMTTLIGFAGLAIDGSNIYYQNQRMQIAADAAALAGARQLALGESLAVVDAEIQSLGEANAADTAVRTGDIYNDNGVLVGVRVTATREFDSYFARVFGYSLFTARAQAEAQYEPVTGIDNLYPLTLDCECFGDGSSGPIDDGGGDGGGPGQPPDPDDGSGPTSGTIELTSGMTSTYMISYEGRTEKTWTYRVDELEGRDLSHWLLNIESCLDSIVSYNPSGAEIGVDGSTGIPGIKWNVNEDFTSGYFSFTLNDHYPAGLVEAVAKAGNEFGSVFIRGPICDGTNGDPGVEPGDPDTGNYCLPTIDFETDAAGAALATGQIIDNEWAAWGIHVTSSSPSNHPPMIFNSASPTGNDPDLGTPNQDFGGPGIGAGGRMGQPGQNSTPLGKVLIIAERNNPADPDDNAGGGSLIFTFDLPVRMDEVRILDIDDVAAAGVVKAYADSAGTALIATGKMLGLGDNSVQTVGVNARNVRRLEIQFPASGAVAELVSCRNQAISTYNLGDLVWWDLNENGLQDEGEPGIAGVVVELYLAGQDSVIARTTTNAWGKYQFKNLPPGNYEVKIAPENFESGGPLEGATYSPKDVNAGGGGGGEPQPNAACVETVNSGVAALNQYNLIVLEDLKRFGEVDYHAYIGGNLTHNNSVQFGTHSSASCSAHVLTLVGSMSPGNPINMQRGSLALGGSRNGRAINFNGGQACKLVQDPSLNAAPMTGLMQALSAELAGMEANNAAPQRQSNGQLLFRVTEKTPEGLAVFDVRDVDVFENRQINNMIEFNNQVGATTILVNVSGAVIDWNNTNMGNFLGSYNSNIAKVIWNFHQATSIKTYSKRFGGALLAPYADLDAGSGNMEGSTLVKTLTNAGEIHSPVFNLSNTPPLVGSCEQEEPPPGPGGDDTIDSDFDPSTGRAPAIIVSFDNDTVDGGFIPPEDPGEDDAPTSGVIELKDNKDTRIEVSFISREGPTWTYRVREVGGRDLSHWVLVVPPCVEKVVGMSPSGSLGRDGSTGYTGIKWDVGDGFENELFTFTLDDIYARTTVEALAKAGTGHALIPIVGPDCTKPETGDDPGDGDPGDGSQVEVPEGACPFKWISWEHDRDNDGWTIGRTIPDVVDVPPEWITTVLDDLQGGADTITIPLTDFDNGYAICGFAEVEVVEHDEEERVWIVARLLKTLLRGFATDPNGADFGVRDVRFVQ